MAHYLLTGKKTQTQLKVGYNTEGAIVSFEMLGDWADSQRVYLLYQLLPNIEMETRLKNRDKALTDIFRIELIPADLSFEAFWNAYTNKVGNKERAKKLWLLLPDEDRVKALLGIKKYNNYLAQNPTVVKLYPETYLNQRRWEN